MSKLSRISNGVLAFILGVLSSGLLQLYTAPKAAAYSTDPNASFNKVWVCKYTGTPGVNEAYKNGKNPTSVAAGTYHLGDEFTDAQGRSVVIAWDDGGADAPLSICPVPNTVTTVAPTQTPVCGANNDIVTLATTTGVTYSQTGWVNNSNTVTATPNAGVTLSGNSSWVLTDANVACPVVLTPVVAQAPTVTPVCGPNNDIVTLATTTGVTYSQTGWVNNANTVNATANAGYILSGTSSWPLVDANAACPLTPVQPDAPTQSDYCGIENDSVVAPDNKTGVTYSVNHNGTTWNVVATPASGYEIDVTGTDYVLNNDGTATWSTTLTDQECKVTICHRTDSATNPYTSITVSEEAVDGQAGNSGNEADHFGEHQGPIASSEDVANDLKDQKIEWGDIIPPLEGVHDGLNWTAVGQAMLENDCNFVTEVTPPAPVPIDLCYTDQDYVVVPSKTGVQYLYNNEDVSNTIIYFNGDPITITAVAEKGYIIPDGATTEWTFDSETFTNEQCVVVTKSAKTVSDTNKDGVIGVGDTVTWEITVTNTSTQEVEGFKVDVDDDTAVLENDGVIDNLAAGESVTLTATSELTIKDLILCKVTNTATFKVWRAEEIIALKSDLIEQADPLATGSADATYNLTCNPGKGAGTPETPAELPHTGPTDLSSYFALIAGILTYGATYILQPKKKYQQYSEQN